MLPGSVLWEALTSCPFKGSFGIILQNTDWWLRCHLLAYGNIQDEGEEQPYTLCHGHPCHSRIEKKKECHTIGKILLGGNLLYNMLIWVILIEVAVIRWDIKLVKWLMSNTLMLLYCNLLDSRFKLIGEVKSKWSLITGVIGLASHNHSTTG